MIGRLHGVFLAYLVLALVWNLAALRRAPRWERWTILPLLALAAVVLVRDRLVGAAPAWLTTDPVPHLFPLLFALALVQQLAVIAGRGPRLSDVPFVLFDVGVGGALLVADLALHGHLPSPSEAALLGDHLVLQALLGTHVAPSWTLAWHLPWLLPREPPTSLAGAAARLLPAAVAAFGVVVLAALHGSSAEVAASFLREPTALGRRPALELGAWWRPDVERSAPPPVGSLAAWVLPADHDGTGLPSPGAPLVLALRAPDAWQLDAPPREVALDAFAEGAERLAARLRPTLLLPFPEPDGEAPLFLAAPLRPADWRALLVDLRPRVSAASPNTRLGVRLAGIGARSRALFDELAPVVDVLGPRLLPGGAQQGGAAAADVVLDAWREWRVALAARGKLPALWILAAGASPLAYGEAAQASFVEGCVARANADDAVAALLLDGGTDAGHTLGLLRPDRTPRRALRRLQDMESR